MTAPLGILIGAKDFEGQDLRTGDVVRFQYRRYDDDGEFDVYEAVGELRLSAYVGAYIVRPGGRHRLYRKTVLTAIGSMLDTDHASLLASDPVRIEGATP